MFLSHLLAHTKKEEKERKSSGAAAKGKILIDAGGLRNHHRLGVGARPVWKGRVTVAVAEVVPEASLSCADKVVLLAAWPNRHRESWRSIPEVRAWSSYPACLLVCRLGIFRGVEG